MTWNNSEELNVWKSESYKESLNENSVYKYFMLEMREQ